MGWGRGLVLQWLVGLDQCHTIKVTPFLGYRLLEGDVGLLLTKDMAILCRKSCLESCACCPDECF